MPDPLWFFAEVAICATNLAELIGTAIALELLFSIPLLCGMLNTALSAFLRFRLPPVLLLFALDCERLGTLVALAWQIALGWATAAVIVGLTVKLLFGLAFGD